MKLQIATRVSGDVTILDLRGRLTIDGGTQLLSSYLQRLVASDAGKLLPVRFAGSDCIELPYSSLRWGTSMSLATAGKLGIGQRKMGAERKRRRKELPQFLHER